MADLTGKVAVVTGASKGIGAATAIALGAAGDFCITSIGRASSLYDSIFQGFRTGVSFGKYRSRNRSANASCWMKRTSTHSFAWAS